MKKIALVFFTCFICLNLSSQEKTPSKAQPSDFLSKAYYSINFGGIFYPFSNDNLIDGYKTDTYSRNYFSGRLLMIPSKQSCSEWTSGASSTTKECSWREYVR